MIKRTIPRFLPETRAGDILRALLPDGKGRVDQETVLRRQLAEITAAQAVQLMPSARAGLYWLLRSIRPPRLYLPAFLCSSVYEAAMRAETPMTYLDCQEGSFATRLDGVDYEPGSVLLLVHQYGIPSDPVAATAVAERYGLLLVEDAAPSLGACWNGRPTGSFGAASIVSFEYSKTISACKGGAMLYTDTSLAEKVAECIAADGINSAAGTEKAWRSDALNGILYALALAPLIYGSLSLPLFRARHGGFVDRSQTIELTGPYRSDFGNNRAWLALHMLERLPSIADARRRVAAIYRDVLADEPEIMLAPVPEEAQPVYTHFPLLVPAGKREAIVSGLWAAGIDPGFNFSYLCGGDEAAKAAPIALDYTSRVLTLPISSRVDEGCARRIAETLRNLVRTQ